MRMVHHGCDSGNNSRALELFYESGNFGHYLRRYFWDNSTCAWGQNFVTGTSFGIRRTRENQQRFSLEICLLGKGFFFVCNVSLLIIWALLEIANPFTCGGLTRWRKTLVDASIAIFFFLFGVGPLEDKTCRVLLRSAVTFCPSTSIKNDQWISK